MCVSVCVRVTGLYNPYKGPGCLFLFRGSQEVQNISVSVPTLPPQGGSLIYRRGRGNRRGLFLSVPSARPSVTGQRRSRWNWEERGGKLRGNAGVTGLCKEAPGRLSVWHCKHNEMAFPSINLSRSAFMGIYTRSTELLLWFCRIK